MVKGDQMIDLNQKVDIIKTDKKCSHYEGACEYGPGCDRCVLREKK